MLNAYNFGEVVNVGMGFSKHTSLALKDATLGELKRRSILGEDIGPASVKLLITLIHSLSGGLSYYGWCTCYH